MKEYFMKTSRVGFSKWDSSDRDLAIQLWGEEAVTKFLCSSGKFTTQDIVKRLELEDNNEEMYHVQYWPIFELTTNELIGCCGIRPYQSDLKSFEIGFHLRRKYWGAGFGFESASKVIDNSFEKLLLERLYAGHHPDNVASRKLLMNLGFHYKGENFYEPTGLNHPLYELMNSERQNIG